MCVKIQPYSLPVFPKQLEEEIFGFLPLFSEHTKKEPSRTLLNGGEGGIRTHGTLARSTVFKTAPINRSGTSPNDCLYTHCSN